MTSIRNQIDDFEVDEILEAPADGGGDYLWLRVEKRDLGTPEAARALARWCRVPEDRVTFAGRKDRRAVTRQWFSIHRGVFPHGEPPDGMVVLDRRQSNQRLRLGELVCNRFRVVVRDVDAQAVEHVLRTAPKIRARGFPNAFGPQRFGPEQVNVARARRLLAGELTVGRRDRRFLVSAIQSAVFNRVLELRPVGVDEVVVGDLAISHRTGLVRSVVDPAEIEPRVSAGKLSPSGPLPGPKTALASGEPGRIELEVCRAEGLVGQEFKRRLEDIGMAGERRSLRAFCRDLEVETPEVGTLVLDFSLAPGSYATSLIGALLGRSPADFA